MDLSDNDNGDFDFPSSNEVEEECDNLKKEVLKGLTLKEEERKWFDFFWGEMESFIKGMLTVCNTEYNGNKLADKIGKSFNYFCEKFNLKEEGVNSASNNGGFRIMVFLFIMENLNKYIIGEITNSCNVSSDAEEETRRKIRSTAEELLNN